MIGAPLSAHEKLDAITAIVNVADEAHRAMDRKWGTGRLPKLVPVEWAEKFASQQRKFATACQAWEVEPIRKQGEAMVRAYAKLDELATEAGAEQSDAIQWETVVGDELWIFVRDIADVGRVDTHGRQAQVWSLDEVAAVLGKTEALAETKRLFPGSVVESVRPRDLIESDVPF